MIIGGILEIQNPIFLIRQTTKSSVLISDRNYQDNYNDPGNFVTEKNDYGSNVLVSKIIKLI